MCWMDLELCTRDSRCKYWPTRELVHHAHSLPDFLDLWCEDWSYLKKKSCFGHWTVCMGLMDLELCTRDGRCKYWPTKELVHQAHSFLEFLGLWRKYWPSLKNCKMLWPWLFLRALNRACTYIWIGGWRNGTDWWLMMYDAHVIDTLQDKIWKLEEII